MNFTATSIWTLSVFMLKVHIFKLTRLYDNSLVKRFYASLKKEEIFHHTYNNLNHLKNLLTITSKSSIQSVHMDHLDI